MSKKIYLCTNNFYTLFGTVSNFKLGLGNLDFKRRLKREKEARNLSGKPDGERVGKCGRKEPMRPNKRKRKSLQPNDLQRL